MQGWRPLTQLSQIQRNFLAEAGISDNHFPLDNPDWTLNKRLIVAVSIELENIKSIASGEVPESNVGSQGQLTLSNSDDNRLRTAKLLDYEGRSNTDMIGPISMMGIRHMYRVRHIVDDDNKNWSVCWSLNHTFDPVPNGWIPTINQGK